MNDRQHEIECLGYFAAMCDLYAAYPNVPKPERERLIARAQLYRNRQLALMADPAEFVRATADRIIEAMKEAGL